jgi:hypothetical protein
VNRLEGRVAVGLDEFMLRLGHLKVLAQLLPDMSVSKERVVRRLAARLQAPTPVAAEDVLGVGRYLIAKKLSWVAAGGSIVAHPHSKARYQNLTVHKGDSGEPVSITAVGSAPPAIWYQDWAIAQPDTRSKVGAVTFEVRESANKSGVSHVVDWAELVGVTNPRLGLTAVGRALGAVCTHLAVSNSGESANPYVVGAERVLFLWLLFMQDGDVLLRLVREIVAERSAIDKAQSKEIMKRVFKSLHAEMSRTPGGVSSRVARAVRDLQEDLGLGRGGVGDLSKREVTSTMWHRVSSRLEALTDVGVLEKCDSTGSAKPFDYVYRHTPVAEAIAAEVIPESGVTEWLEGRLTDLLYGELQVGSSEETAGDLLQAVRLTIGPTGLHIDSFAATAAVIAAAAGRRLSIALARGALVSLARERPDLARLSRGYSGPRAEIASIDRARLAEAGFDALAVAVSSSA